MESLPYILYISVGCLHIFLWAYMYAHVWRRGLFLASFLKGYPVYFVFEAESLTWPGAHQAGSDGLPVSPRDLSESCWDYKIIPCVGPGN